MEWMPDGGFSLHSRPRNPARTNADVRRKMSTALFILGFLLTGYAGAGVLAKHDAEPAGAFASLILFLSLAAILSVGSRSAISSLMARKPGKLASLLAGVISSAI